MNAPSLSHTVATHSLTPPPLLLNRYEAEYFAFLKPATAAEEAAAADKYKEVTEAATKSEFFVTSSAFSSTRNLTPPPPSTQFFVTAADTAIEAAGESASDEFKALTKATAALDASRTLLADPTTSEKLAALQSRRIAPAEPVVKTLTAIWYLLGRKADSLCDATAPDATAVAWPAAAPTADLIAAVGGGFDATAPAQKTWAYAKADALRALLEAVPPAEELAGKHGLHVAALVAWIRAALDVRDASAAMREKEAAEAAAKKAADEEAAAAAKAAEEEAAGAEEGEEAE